MHSVIESTDKDFIEYINSALRRYGADTQVSTVGYDADGQEIYAVIDPLGVGQHVRHLMHTDADFVNDLFPPYAQRLREIRNANTLRIAGFLTSPVMVKLSLVALAVLVVGLLFE